jgi:hypothetical protein
MAAGFEAPLVDLELVARGATGNRPARQSRPLYPSLSARIVRKRAS